MTGQFLWQNVFGVWPVSGEVSAALRGRLHTYAEKAIREAAWHTSWHNPNRAFEDDVHGWLDLVLDGPLASELTGLVAHLNSHAESDALAAKLLALTVPGVPDVYQGSELWDDSLVDPDNRRPVDYGTRRVALKALQHPKIRVLARRFDCGAPIRRASWAAHTIRCSPPGRPPTTSLRSAAVTTSWSR